MSNKEVYFCHTANITPVKTSHLVGEKRVIATEDEVNKPITQIARTQLFAKDEVAEHLHPTMDEHFFFLKGESEVNVDGIVYNCIAEDYLYIPAGHNHSIVALSDTEMLTIGIAICSKNILE